MMTASDTFVNTVAARCPDGMVPVCVHFAVATLDVPSYFHFFHARDVVVVVLRAARARVSLPHVPLLYVGRRESKYKTRLAHLHAILNKYQTRNTEAVLHFTYAT
jgi:hypothetical protein